MSYWRVLVLAAAILVAACAAPPPRPQAPPPAPDAEASRYLGAIRDNPPLLLAFLRRFPKGGDLQTHLSGTPYAESLVRWGSEAGLCIDRESFVLGPKPCGSGRPPLAEAVRDAAFYAAVVDAWSMRDFVPAPGRSSHDHFFATFGRFAAATAGRSGDMLAEAAARAADQSVGYLEMMLSPGMAEARRLGAAAGWDDDLGRLADRLTGHEMDRLVAAARAELDQAEARMRALLGCGTPAAAPGCHVTVRYVAQVLRTFPPEQVFAQSLLAYRLALDDPRVVGVSLVGAEDDRATLDGYEQQMRMLAYLGRLHPAVKLALGAGELSLGRVPPEALRWHIRAAVEVAGARRIAYGEDIGHEEQPLQLMAELARRHILVAVTLTSSEVLLGLEGDRHPFATYRQLGVPVALASDDEGVLRIDLTHEFLRAVEEHQLGYSDLKTLARNSLEYSFLPGDSLWITTAPYVLAPPCAEVTPLLPTPPPTCQALLDASEKAREQWRLEVELAKLDASIRSSDLRTPDVAQAP